MAINPVEQQGIDPRCEFHYPHQWRDIVPLLREGLLGGLEDRINEAIGLLDERDRALEDHLTNRPCCECPDDGST